MPTAHRTPAVTVTDRACHDIDTDLLVIPIFEDDDFADLPGLDQASGGEIGHARSRGELKGKSFDVFITPVTGWKARRVALIGLGPRSAATDDHLRRAAITGGLAARHRRVARVAVTHRDGVGVTAERALQVMAEGVVIANFEGAAYKTADHGRVWLESAQLRAAGAKDGDRAVERGMARQTFFWSLWYLALLFAAMVADRLILT